MCAWLPPKTNWGQAGQTVPGAIDFNRIEGNTQYLKDEIDSHKAECAVLLPKAGSTANAILLDIELTDKKKGSFRAAANNTGNMTINGKAFKKDASTQIPANGVKANRVYDFYYDETADCVFILAKASGNAQPSDVLAGKTFSNDDGEQIGTFNLSLYKKWASGSLPDFTTGTTSSLHFAGTVSGLDFAPKTVIMAAETTTDTKISICTIDPYLMRPGELFRQVALSGNGAMTVKNDADFKSDGFDYWGYGGGGFTRTYTNVRFIAIE